MDIIRKQKDGETFFQIGAMCVFNFVMCDYDYKKFFLLVIVSETLKLGT